MCLRRSRRCFRYGILWELWPELALEFSSQRSFWMHYHRALFLLTSYYDGLGVFFEIFTPLPMFISASVLGNHDTILPSLRIFGSQCRVSVALFG